MRGGKEEATINALPIHLLVKQYVFEKVDTHKTYMPYISIMSDESPVLPIHHFWHHAVNSQDELDKVLVSVKEAAPKIQSIEADIIFSLIKQQAVMGHPPENDGDLTLKSFLEQLRDLEFQHSCGICTSRIVKLDFKCMRAFESSITNIQCYLEQLPPQFHHLLWINADILPGPGEVPNDSLSQLKMKPKFDAAKFLRVVSKQLSGTTLSIGWTTSLSDKRALYTEEMVNDMLEVLEPYEKLNITFPIRAISFRHSWDVLQKLYRYKWTVTLWWSLDKLEETELDWIYTTLEGQNRVFRDRTYYDLVGFQEYAFQQIVRP